MANYDISEITELANLKPTVNVPSQLDNYSVSGMANGIINLFSEVAANLQVKYGTTANAWVNIVNDLDDIIYADHIRSIGLDSTATVALQSNDLLQKRAEFLNRQNVDRVQTPNSINDSTGNLLKHYQVILQEKQFANTVVESNVASLNTFISNTLDNNPIYTNYGVSSSRDYAVRNGYVSDYTNLDSSSFDPYSNSKDMQDLAEVRIAAVKTMFLAKKIVQ